MKQAINQPSVSDPVRTFSPEPIGGPRSWARPWDNQTAASISRDTVLAYSERPQMTAQRLELFAVLQADQKVRRYGLSDGNCGRLHLNLKLDGNPFPALSEMNVPPE